MSPEVPHSPGIGVSHWLAATETAALNHERISPDLSICGITKLEDVLSPEVLRRGGVPPQMIHAAIAEAEQILQLFQAAGIEPRGLRRALRARLGDGGYKRGESDHISRSDAVRAAFDRASDIAAENNSPIVMVHQLLAALLEIPDTHTRALLTENGVDVDALREQAATLPMLAIRSPRKGLIDELGVDLTAKAGELPPVIGRRDEMMRVVRILGRDKKNCPVLVGAAGVGKTAIVEGLAQRIAVKNIHPDLHNKRIVQLDASALVASTKYRGDFEERMAQLIAEISADPDLILFIDEIHLLIGAGAGGSSGMDAANILKPALASGKIKLIGATTDAEYRRYIEQDAALERRFEPVRVAEPSSQETVEMLAGARARLQEKHGVTILDEAIVAAVELSVRYITDRFLPDKAYTLLDDACAEARYGSALSFRPDQMNVKQAINAVTSETVRTVLADRLDIPIDRMNEDERERVMRMADELRKRIVGQDAAIEAVAQIVQRHYAGMSAPGRPVGVFLFTGPTGVGKTELAKAIADFLFHDEKRLIRRDMGEYMERHNVARLIGAPPGYTGYEQGGQLTNALREKPAAVVLIDEIEKAHPDVLNVFLGLFDNGRLTDGQGRTVDGQNALFIMTSNLGYTNADTPPTPDTVKRAVHNHLRPEFINRIDAVVYFQPLQAAHMESLVRIQFNRLARQLERHFIGLEDTNEAVKWLAVRGYDPQMGARALIRLFEVEVVTPISRMVLSGELAAGENALVDVQDDALLIKRIVAPTNYQ